MRFKECNYSLSVKEVRSSRVNGFWTDKKELALLKEYTSAQILTSLNEVNPSDPPLSYDSCRRAVDRLVGSYSKSFEKSHLASLSGANRNRSEVEKAVYIIIQKRKMYDNFKREGREKVLERNQKKTEMKRCMRALAGALGNHKRNARKEIRERRRVEKEANARNNEPRSHSPPVEEAVSGSGSFRKTELPVETEAASGDRQNEEDRGSLSISEEERLVNMEGQLSNIEKLLEQLINKIK
ncbi:hypothetical protein CLU79DRAFT_782365 [Phycomyces nitens]|nr:hypothetical protein CLU79DRAFT_782365 [Phycomyces nitens]